MRSMRIQTNVFGENDIVSISISSREFYNQANVLLNIGTGQIPHGAFVDIFAVQKSIVLSVRGFLRPQSIWPV